MSEKEKEKKKKSKYAHIQNQQSDRHELTNMRRTTNIRKDNQNKLSRDKDL